MAGKYTRPANGFLARCSELFAKYAAKSEVQSQSYEEVRRHSFSVEASNADTVKKAIRKMLTKSVAEKDYSAQECFHLLMGYPLYHVSREFVTDT